MATSLAAQLAQVAANSKSTLNVKAQKAAHSKSLIWEPRVAATQSYQTLYTTCIGGFEELCQLDARFTPFLSTIFSEESQNQDRTQLTAAENEELDRRVEAFLRLAGSRIRLMPAIKSIEWLIRRFRIHEENTQALLLTFLPYHSIPAFATLLSILPTKIPYEFRFLDPYIRSATCPPRSVLVRQAILHPAFLTLISEYTLESCRMQYNYPALISFWAGIMTEAVSGILDKTRSGRANVQSENDQNLLHRLGPIFAESLVMKKVPSIQVASYMAIAVFVAKGHLEDNAVTAFMDQTVYGWTNETVRPALVVLAILAQYRSAKQMSGKTTKALMKVTEIGNLLVEIGQERRVDKLANGLCLALIERLTKKGDARGLATIITILSSSVLKDKQIAVVFKSLILTAHRLNGDNDENGSLRRELGSALIALSQITGKSGETIQSVIDEVKFDIEELEMKLDLSFRSRRLPETIKDDQDMSNGIDEKKAPQDLSLLLKELSGRSESLSPCLVPQPGEVFDEFSHIFFSVVSESSQNTELLSEFEMNPKLRRQAAFKDCTYFSFFIRIWSGPYPALARVAALDMVKRRLKVGDAGKIDLQALLPYCISALGDPSKRVRKAAADLVTVLTALYVPPVPAGGLELWGEKSLYGKAKGFKSLASDIVAKVLHLQLLPTVEECVMDPEHIAAVLRTAIEQGKYQFKPDPALDKKDHLSQPGRLSFLEFLASHIVHSPLMLVKSRLLKIVNEVRGVGTRTRTDFLLEVLEWWASLSEDEAAKLCSSERLETLDMDNRFVDVVVPNDLKGLEFFLEFLRGQEQREKAGLIRAIFARMRKIWTSMKPDVKFTAAEQLLEISQESTVSTDFTSVVSTEAADFLRNVRLTTDILDYFLKSIPTGTKMITEPPSNKRRRASSSSGGRVVNPVAPELSQELRKVTFILQLVENSDPAEHPDLLDGLFTALSELQHMRTVVGAELGYLQNLVLRSLLAMMPVYKSKKYNKKLEIDSSVGYGDLLVNCIQKSSSPVVQNAALLLVASLATAAPNLVLHSVMPIFTFMGVSVLRQSDDYSAHVVSQTIKEVIPPLIGSMRQGNNNPIIGACDILVSFTAAFEHIPAHRRQGLFVALVETLGPEDFLHAIIGMLVDKYGPSDALLQFIVELLNHFSILTQLKTLVELLDLIADLFKPKPGISSVLLGISDEKNEKDKDLQEIALKQLSAFPSFLANKKLRSQIGGLMETDDMEASGLRDLYAKLLENILILADTVKADKTLHGRCGQALSNHLNLLSIGEFIKAVENLLDRPDMGLRQKVLRALEARVEQESNTDPASRTVLLAFLPQLTAGIRESTDIRYKHTAVTCVDKISEKYGKKDIEAVVAAATTIAGDYCLGQSEQRLRVMALLCLTSLVDVLQDAIVPVLPSAIPQAIEYLGESVEGAVDQELHVASYGFISALAQYLPYMLSTSTYIDRILEVSNKSAELDLDDNTRESRVDCLHFLAKQLEAKEIFSALDRNWESARKAGFSAVAEYLDVLGLAIDKHPKSGISKNAMLLASVLTKVFDLRRREHAKGEFGEQNLLRLSALDASANDKALKMIYKLNDAAFRPVFDQIITWSSSGLKDDRAGRALRQLSVYGFLEAFFGTLKSIVTNYATYILEDAVKILTSVDLKSPEERQLWARVLQTLGNCFEHDQDDFWQAPAHFSAIGPVLMDQFSHAGTVDVTDDLIPTTVELASAADSQAHQKELNSALLKHLRSESPAIRLAAVKCEQALTDRLGEEWLAMLHEMLPRISELQEDDDEEVERETHRWIVKIEGVLGEDLDDMLR